MKLRQTFTALTPTLLALAVAATPALAQDSAVRAQTQTDAQPNQSVASGLPLTDGQILQIVRTLNDAEIKQADEALDQGESESVKQVAEMIKMEHEAANEQVDELLDGELNLEDSPLNDTLAQNAEDTHELLQDLEGEQYECAYLEQQVAQHEAAIQTAETQLMPNAKDPGVAQFLTAMGPKLEHHLQMAQQSLGSNTACGDQLSSNRDDAEQDVDRAADR